MTQIPIEVFVTIGIAFILSVTFVEFLADAILHGRKLICSKACTYMLIHDLWMNHETVYCEMRRINVFPDFIAGILIQVSLSTLKVHAKGNKL